MARRYHLSISVEDEIDADDIDEAWAKFKARWEDRFYGPTVHNIQDLGQVEKEVTE